MVKKIISVALVVVTIICTLSISASAASYTTGSYKVASSSGVNVRSGAGTNYSKVGAAAQNVIFTVTKVSGSWGYTSSIKCTNGAKSGWVSLDYCKKQSANTSSYATGTYTVASSSGVNVRSGAGTNYSKVGAAAHNISFTVTKVSGSWGYTSSIKCTNGTKSGWVSLDYCKKVTTVAGNTSAKTIKLNVPLYKQSDSRWKNVYIGSNTIGNVGCLITSVAMVYSYHTGKTVYPNSVMNKLRFSNNSLYWSTLSNVGLTSKQYNCAISNSMMSTIYSKLKAGKPVIIGAVTSSGNDQHWVVITGYTGTSTTNFSTGDFIINDPGYQCCTTLKAFLANGSRADRTKIIRLAY